MKILYPYQLTGARFLTDRHAALLGDAMGLGKTPQATLAGSLDEAITATVRRKTATLAQLFD